MKNVYDENGGYTPEANDLDKEVRDGLRLFIKSELKAGTPIECLQYVIENAVSKEILAQSIALRLEKSKEK